MSIKLKHQPNHDKFSLKKRSRRLRKKMRVCEFTEVGYDVHITKTVGETTSEECIDWYDDIIDALCDIAEQHDMYLSFAFGTKDGDDLDIALTIEESPNSVKNWPDFEPSNDGINALKSVISSKGWLLSEKSFIEAIDLWWGQHNWWEHNG